MDGPHGLGPQEPILIRYVIVGTGEDYLNKILQCLHVPEAGSFPLRLRDADTGEEFDVMIDRLSSVEHDTLQPGTVHFTARDRAGHTVTAHLNHLIQQPNQPIGFATIGLRL